jgi:hypothetical protein
MLGAIVDPAEFRDADVDQLPSLPNPSRVPNRFGGAISSVRLSALVNRDLRSALMTSTPTLVGSAGHHLGRRLGPGVWRGLRPLPGQPLTRGAVTDSGRPGGLPHLDRRRCSDCTCFHIAGHIQPLAAVVLDSARKGRLAGQALHCGRLQSRERPAGRAKRVRRLALGWVPPNVKAGRDERAIAFVANQ